VPVPDEVKLPPLPVVKKRLVEEAVVEKRLVVVAEVVVERVMLLKMWAPVQVGVKAWSTETALTLLVTPLEKVRAFS
jgi:cephalosporin-C deacetylase-like acetyl esterase